MNKEIYVGFDVHADTIAVAIAEVGRDGEVRFFGTIKHSGDAVLCLTKQLSTDSKVPTLCYEAGPCGYGLHRLLKS